MFVDITTAVNKPENIAVIDLGSNTFHILIVDPIRQKEVYRERVFVSLAEEGIQRIGDEAFERGIHTLTYFSHLMKTHHVVQYRMVGTAALRAACNAREFILQTKANTGLDIKVIDGFDEAKYIAKGIQSIVPMKNDVFLIMDIGGGSVEFILMEHGHIELVRSYNIGIGQLYNMVSHSHPLEQNEKHEIKQLIQDTISDITSVIAEKPISGLVGASGSFEVLEDLQGLKSHPNQYNRISSENAKKHIQAVFECTYGELLTNPSIPRTRAKLIVLAFLLIDVVLDLTSIADIFISPVAMKEGILAEMMESRDNE